MFGFSKSPTLEELRQKQNEFVYDKMKWDNYQTPRNLFFALVGELGELVTDVVASDLGTSVIEDGNDDEIKDGEKEEKDESGTDEDNSKYEIVLDELVDVLSYLIHLAQICRVDLAAPFTAKSSRIKSEFTDNSWEELEVAAFYNVSVASKTTLLQDVFKLTFAASELCDHFQWYIVEKYLSNLSSKTQEKVEKVLKNMFCFITAIASKFKFDLPRFLDAKNARCLVKYINSEGVLSKEDVLVKRYSDLPTFRLGGKKVHPDNYKLQCKSTTESLETVQGYLANLVKSIGLVCELFQWDPEGHEIFHSDPKHAHLAHQLAVIQYAVLQIAQHYNISLSEAFCRKMTKNNKKYPVSLVYGNLKKYNEYKENSCSDHDKSLYNNTDTVNSEIKSSKKQNVDTVSVSSDLTIVGVSKIMNKFVADRNWEQYHTPRNLTIALYGEIGEVIELFIERSKSPDIQYLSDELADCTAYIVRLAKQSDVNLSDALHHYFSLNP